MKAVNPRSITEAERPFLDLDLTPADQARLVDALIEHVGCSSSQALGVIGWLAVKKAGGLDRTTQATRARYRRWLADTPIIHGSLAAAA